MSEFVRCSSGATSPAWTCVLPAGHDDGHIYSPWSQIAAMAEAEIRLRESAMQRVRELRVPDTKDPDDPWEWMWRLGYVDALRHVALDGDGE